MRRQLPTLAFLIGAACAGAITPVLAGESECYNDWSVAAAIVEQEKLVTVDKLTSAAKALMPGDIVKTTLCHEAGKYVFRLVVRNKGALKSLTLDAHDASKK